MSSTSYYWVRNDASKQYPDIIQHNRTPGWGLNVFYESEEEIASRGTERLDSLKFELSFERANASVKKTDFVYFNPSVLTCTSGRFELFSDLIRDQCVCFPLLIELKSYVAFRPKEHFDVLDRDNTVCSVSSSGILYNFKKLSIVSPPHKNADFFGVTNVNGLSAMQILASEAFKNIYDETGMTGLQFLPALRLN